MIVSPSNGSQSALDLVQKLDSVILVHIRKTESDDKRREESRTLSTAFVEKHAKYPTQLR